MGAKRERRRILQAPHAPSGRKTIRRGAVLVGLLVICTWGLALEAIAQCGSERWSVKTGTDGDVSLVHLSVTPTPTTIASLAALQNPGHLPASNRISPTETTVWVVTATLTDFKREDDLDYHLVLRDDAGNTLIAEIPSPSCVGAGSHFASPIANVRAAFDAQYQVTTSWKHPNIPVQVTGVGFFDIHHGTAQRGVAPNDIELHPILAIAFNPTASPAAVTTHSLADLGFEDGPGTSAWQASPQVIYNSDRQPAHTGSYEAWLAGYAKVHTDTLSQKVTLPSGASHITFSFWILINTDEVKSQPFDKMRVQVKDASDAVLSTLGTFSNLDATSDYAQKSYDLTSFGGRTVQIVFTATEDPMRVTSFVIDDVALATSP